MSYTLMLYYIAQIQGKMVPYKGLLAVSMFTKENFLLCFSPHIFCTTKHMYTFPAQDFPLISRA